MIILDRIHQVVLIVVLILAIISPVVESNDITTNPSVLDTENITHGSTINTTEANTYTTTDKITENPTLPSSPPVTTTSSIPDTTKLPIPSPPPTLDSFYCGCDYHFNFCDLNCCCDPDCSAQEKAVFSACSTPPPRSSQLQRSCRSYDYFFRNNTPFTMEKTKSGLFCIAYDNYKGHDELDASKFEPGTIQKPAKYKWKHLAQPLILANKKEPYKYKSVIKIVREINDKKFLGVLDMPSAFHRQECIAREPVLFLQNTAETCFQQLTNLEHDCATLKSLNPNTFIQNISVIGNSAKNFSDENLIPFTLMTCEGSIYKCKRTDASTLKKPNFDKSTGCTNVLQALDFTIVHNGVEGIKQIFAKLLLVNISDSVIRQEFSTNFEWVDDQLIDDKNETVVSGRIPKSGNPGYIFGKPILMGIKVHRDQAIGLTKSTVPDESKQTNENGSLGKSKEVILLNYDPRKWMTVFGPGACSSSNNRKPVLFGRTISTACSLDVSTFKTCRGLQNSIETILLGVPLANFTKRYVSAFGNPKFDNIKNWLSVLTSDPPITTSLTSLVKHGCDGIKASLHIQIAYTNVGPVDNPQAAILGVRYQFGASNNLPNETSLGGEKQIFISTTVGFNDLTSRPVRKLAEWPTISIQLPPDFFYPFTWSSSSSSCRHNVRIFTWVLPLVGWSIFVFIF